MRQANGGALLCAFTLAPFRNAVSIRICAQHGELFIATLQMKRGSNLVCSEAQVCDATCLIFYG